MYTYLLAAIISAALSGIGVWKVQDWRYGAKEADRITAAREKEKLDRLVENRLSGNVIGALNDAKKREATARGAAADALSERDSLHDDLAKLRNDLPSISANACKERVATLSQLFDQCAGAYQGMAETAQRHANDTLTLEQAWPK
jgi:hypothetical protein